MYYLNMEYTKLIVTNPRPKENIGAYLRHHNISYRYLEKLKKTFGHIKLNGQIAKADTKVKAGDVIEIKSNVQTKSNIQTCIIPLDIVFEDDNILIINKPAGLATMPTKSVYNYNLAGAIMFYMEKKDPNFVCRIINRLDKEVSGLVLVAKNSFTASFFNANPTAFNKTYHALVTGMMSNNLTIDKKIATLVDENGFNQRARVIDEENGLEATTFVEPIKYLKSIDCTLAKITIKNGRTHQIRVHTSSVGHPLLGDTIYGEPSQLLSHTALICKELEIISPTDGSFLKFVVPYPSDIQRLLVGEEC